MRVLIVAATEPEVTPLLFGLGDAQVRPDGVPRYLCSGHEVGLLMTGVGMVATAARVARALSIATYDVAFNVGVCGAFGRALALGTVVHVVSDHLVEMGAEDGDTFLTTDELNLVCATRLTAVPPASTALARLPSVTGITVNTIHGNERSIAAVTERFSPHVESMEGAAFMYACMIHGPMPFAEVRAVSNIVEKRNRAAWRLDAAASNLATSVLGILETL